MGKNPVYIRHIRIRGTSHEEKLVALVDRLGYFLKSTIMDIHCNAVIAAVNLWACFSEVEKVSFLPILREIISGLGSVAGSEDVVNDLLTKLRVDINPLSLTREGHIETVMKSLINLADSANVQFSTNEKSLKLIVHLVSSMQATSVELIIRNSQVRDLIRTLLKIMSEDEEEYGWYTKFIDDEALDNVRPKFECGVDACTRIFAKLGSRRILKCISNDMDEYIVDPAWRMRRAAIIAIGLLPLDEDLTKEKRMSKIMKWIAISLNDRESDMKVRWSACKTVMRLVHSIRMCQGSLMKEYEEIVNSLAKTSPKDTPRLKM